MNTSHPMTLADYLANYCRQGGDAACATIMQHLAATCAKLSHNIRQGALAGLIGSTHHGNIQGEIQQKLDVFANKIILDTAQSLPSIAGMVSEEEDSFRTGHSDGHYLLLFDPLDGSSNIDVNIPVGSIFSILPRPTTKPLSTNDFLQAGQHQLAAAYALYGSQTQWVMTLNQGVVVFTLGHDNEWYLTGDNIRIDHAAKEFAINMSNQRHWYPAIARYIAELIAGDTGIRHKNYNMRWVASLVAEVSRILTRGGVFLYPKDQRPSCQNGKLRLLYEANPMALIIKNAGGSAISEDDDILNIQPQALHQRTGLILGASEEIAHVKQYLQQN